MSKKFFYLALLMCGGFAKDAKADCDAILTSGLRNITVSYSAEAAIARKYYNNYKKDIHTMSEDQLANLEVEVFGSGKGNGGYTRAQREADLHTWFETNQSVAESAKTQYVASDTVYQGAVNAWAACNALNLNNVEINPQISTDNKTVALSIRYRGVTSTGVKFYGITPNNFQCAIDGPSGHLQPGVLKTGVEITNQSISVICERNAAQAITVNGESFQKLARGTIAVRTAANPFLLTFAEEITPTLPKATADKLNDRIGKLEQKVATLEKDLSEAKVKLNKDIDSIQEDLKKNYVRKDDHDYVKYDQVLGIQFNNEPSRCIKGKTDARVLNDTGCETSNSEQWWKLHRR